MLDISEKCYESAREKCGLTRVFFLPRFQRFRFGRADVIQGSLQSSWAILCGRRPRVYPWTRVWPFLGLRWRVKQGTCKRREEFFRLRVQELTGHEVGKTS